MLCLYFAWRNFVRIHQTLAVTPAMAEGIDTTVWEIARRLNISQRHFDLHAVSVVPRSSWHEITGAGTWRVDRL
jgi:hypothetical protein